MDSVVRKIIIFFITIVIFIPNLDALEVCEMSEEYRNWLSLSDEERRVTIVPKYCKELYKNSSTSSLLKSSRYTDEISINTRNNDILKATASQSKYNALDEGIITPAKNQLATNSCWAFTATSLVETSALRDGLSLLDLSERHIEYGVTRNAYTDGVNNEGFNRVLDIGGNSYLSASYFFKHTGPILEEYMPYQTYNTKIPKSSMPNTKTLLDVGEYNVEFYTAASGCAGNQITSMKEDVIKYGSVGVAIYYDDAYIKNKIYYNHYDTKAPNHAVTIVGWDDSIAVSNFYGNPSTKGAWIAKNSWGTAWGDQGFFYISYSDMRVCNNPYTFSDIKVNTYDNAYAASETIANLSFYNEDNNLFIATKFAKKSNETEYLDKISVEFNEGNTYEVYISTTNDLNNQSSWKKISNGYVDIAGVKSFSFSPIAITGDYTIIVKYLSGLFPMMCKTTSSSDSHYYMDITKSRNYYSFGGKEWKDTADASGNGYKGCEPIIYAYTRNSSAKVANFNINSIVGSSSSVYTHTDDYFTISTSAENIISYKLFRIRVLNSNGVDVTNYFDITNNMENGNVILKPNANAKAGNYTFELSYDNNKKVKDFTLYAFIESNSYTIDGEYIYINMKTENELSKATFMNNINTFGSSYNLLSSSGSDITSSVSLIGTGTKVKIGDNTLIVVLKGDVSGDGKIMGNDALLISRSIVNLQVLSKEATLAADVSSDNKVMGNDSLIISRFLVGLQKSL